MIKKIGLLVLIIFFNLSVFAQSYSTKSKKALKHFQKAYDAFYYQDYKLALLQIQKAIDSDKKFIEAYLLKAETLYQCGRYDDEIIEYNNVIELNPNYDTKVYYLLATAYFNKNDYELALLKYKSFLKFEKIDERLSQKATKNIQIIQFRIDGLNNPVPFTPLRLNDSINTNFDDYSPSLNASGDFLVFVSRLPADERSDVIGGFQEDIFFSRKIDTSWSKAINAGAPINTYNNEGAQTISVDGQLLMFTSCTCPDRTIACCDIYQTRFDGENWSFPIKLPGLVNSPYWDSQPSLSSDGQKLYFASNRPGGKGKTDIWVSTLNADKTWSLPVNLGDTINTSEDEISPFIHADNQTLYFASNGHIGFGGFDLFISKLDSNSRWTDVRNLGFPINSFGDERRLIVNAEGNKAMFSSDRNKETGQDLYEFSIYDKISPTPVTYLKGLVYDAHTNKGLNANLELIDIEAAKNIMYAESNINTGKYLICLPKKKNYALNVSCKNYMFHSENFSLKNLSDTIQFFILDIPLRKINKGETIVLKNIFYETDSHILEKKSFSELNKLIEFLNLNPHINIEIGGHTDNVGTKEYNLQLSQNRAQSVENYLIEHGIQRSRLSSKGYGLTQPIADNNTIKGRALNRRTEVKILN